MLLRALTQGPKQFPIFFFIHAKIFILEHEFRHPVVNLIVDTNQQVIIALLILIWKRAQIFEQGSRF
jgi:hypothetical protein